MSLIRVGPEGCVLSSSTGWRLFASAIVLARFWKTEHDQDAVALETGNASAVLADDLPAKRTNHAEQIGVMLRLHEISERRRAGEIREEHRHVSALPSVADQDARGFCHARCPARLRSRDSLMAGRGVERTVPPF